MITALGEGERGEEKTGVRAEKLEEKVSIASSAMVPFARNSIKVNADKAEKSVVNNAI